MEENPFSFVILPLENIPEVLWKKPSWKESKDEFRKLATTKERFWVKKLNTLWPHGWNSTWPGKPINARVARLGRTLPTPIEEYENPQLWSSYLVDYEINPLRVENQLKKLQKLHLRRFLDWLGKKENVKTAAAQALQVLLFDLLKKATPKRGREYIEFLFGTPLVDGCELRRVLRDPQIYTMHPEPHVAASLRVCETYAPQISQGLLNYTSSSTEVNCEADLQQTDVTFPCPCLQALSPSLFEAEKEKSLIEGHVCTPWLKNLKWPYLQAIGKVGRKYRTALSVDEVLQSLRNGLKRYRSWYLKKKGRGKRQQMEQWADAVVRKCPLNLDNVMATSVLKPDVYSGLGVQLRQAKELLSFVPDDRGPQIVHATACCKRWYQQNLKKMLEDSRTYERFGLA